MSLQPENSVIVCPNNYYSLAIEMQRCMASSSPANSLMLVAQPAYVDARRLVYYARYDVLS